MKIISQARVGGWIFIFCWLGASLANDVSGNLLRFSKSNFNFGNFNCTQYNNRSL